MGIPRIAGDRLLAGMSRVRLLRGVSRSVLSAQCQGTAPIALFAVPHSGALGMCTLGRKPSLEDAQLMPRKYYEMPNDVLVQLSCDWDHEARSERLIREIMVVDDVSWDDAQPKYLEIAQANKVGMFVATLPYRVGILSQLRWGSA